MAQQHPKVKYPRGVRKLLNFVDEHPRTGWYLVSLFLLNLLLNLLDAATVDPFWFVR